MKIDIFNHVFPKRFFDEFVNVGSGGSGALKRVRNIPSVVDLDARFRVMDEFGEFRQVISLGSPPRSRCWRHPASPRISPWWGTTGWLSWSPDIRTVSSPLWCRCR